MTRGALDGGIEEGQIEGRIVANEHGTPAAMAAHLRADLTEDSLQRIGLVDGRPQRMPRIDLGHLQRGRVQPRALEGPHVIGIALPG